LGRAKRVDFRGEYLTQWLTTTREPDFIDQFNRLIGIDRSASTPALTPWSLTGSSYRN